MNSSSTGAADFISEAFPHEEMVGTIQSHAVLKLHTRLASSLWLGRPEDKAKNIRPIVGLARFGRQAATIWQESAKDNPVADMTLINIEERFKIASDLLTTNLAAVKELLEGQDTFEEIEDSESVTPMVVRLDFNNHWGFRGAKLLKQYDDIVRLCLTARHLGLYSKEDWEKLVSDSGRRLRGFFGTVSAMPHTHLERKWFKDKAFARDLKKAKRAISKEGKRVPHIPKEVLAGIRKPQEYPRQIILNERPRLRDLKNHAANEKAKLAAKESGDAPQVERPERYEPQRPYTTNCSFSSNALYAGIFEQARREQEASLSTSTTEQAKKTEE